MIVNKSVAYPPLLLRPKQTICVLSPRSKQTLSLLFLSLTHAESQRRFTTLTLAAKKRRTAMGSGSCCCMGCNGGDDDSGGNAGGGLDPKGFLLAMMIALVLFMLCHVRPPRRNSYVVYRCY
ncbi:hypothetical protein GQ55_5G341600 [Panicum hallii var. hallii]|uniref:Transmembrane protein n=1 Tax=Panicum hallii var. hallii TaxID=1504633 RepID=A0A2T7DM21_9POAL|nr:hypothetical protein GQ55_5G341600 [Panicum hallii var. hallii]